MSLIVSEAWDYNLEEEFSALMEASSKCDHCFVAMSTNLSGNIYTSKELSPYHLMKINVDATCIVQLGLAVYDANRNLLVFGSSTSRILTSVLLELVAYINTSGRLSRQEHKV